MKKEFHELHNHSSDVETLYKTDLYSGTNDDLDDTEVYGESFEFVKHSEAINKFKYKAAGATDKVQCYLYYSVDDTFTTNDGYIDFVELENSITDRVEVYNMGRPAFKSGYYRWGYKMSGSNDDCDLEHTVYKSEKLISY